MDHVLLESGVAGIGKTALALLTAGESGAREMKVVSGQIKLNQARILLSSMSDGDVLFIDEAHLLVSGSKANAEWLLNFLQDGVLGGPRGAERMPRITVIAATTDAGKLPKTILSRFLIRPVLDPYTAEEGAQIAKVTARGIIEPPFPLPSDENCAAIARAACNNPRTMKAILANLRDAIFATGGECYDEPHYDLTVPLDWMGLSEDGLTSLARRYLKALYVDFNGEPAGERAIADMLGEPGGVGHTEDLLLSLGFIVKTKPGRLLTQEGIQRVRLSLGPAETNSLPATSRSTPPPSIPRGGPRD